MSEYKVRTVDGKQCLEHRMVVEEVLGIQLRPDQVVHHINGDKTDNRIENLQVMDLDEHTRLHVTNSPQSPEKLRKLREVKKGKGFPQFRSLTDEQVKEIVYALSEGCSVLSLAKKYGVSWKGIENIRRGETYRDVLDTLPPELFPLPEPKRKKRESPDANRKLSPEDITEIRLCILSNHSDKSLARRYGVTSTTIRNIREGKTYQEIPWPQAVAEYLDTIDMKKLADRMLSGPMPDLQDGFDCSDADLAVLTGNQVDEILLKVYSLYPNLHSRLAYVMLRKALSGDHTMLFALFAVSSYAEYIPQLILRCSQASLVF